MKWFKRMKIERYGMDVKNLRFEKLRVETLGNGIVKIFERRHHQRIPLVIKINNFYINPLRRKKSNRYYIKALLCERLFKLINYLESFSGVNILSTSEIEVDSSFNEDEIFHKDGLRIEQRILRNSIMLCDKLVIEITSIEKFKLKIKLVEAEIKSYKRCEYEDFAMGDYVLKIN